MFFTDTTPAPLILKNPVWLAPFETIRGALISYCGRYAIFDSLSPIRAIPWTGTDSYGSDLYCAARFAIKHSNTALKP